MTRMRFPSADPAPRRRAGAAALLVLTVATHTLAGPAGAQTRAPTDQGLQIEDRIDVLRVDRRILAVRAESGGVLEEKLRVDESLRILESDGVIGVAVTDERLLGVTTQSGSWQEIRLRKGESVPEEIHLAERLALVLLERRLLALTRGAGIWSELELFSGELPARIELDSGVGVCLTGRRAIAISSEGTGFVEVRLTPREEVEAVTD